MTAFRIGLLLMVTAIGLAIAIALVWSVSQVLLLLFASLIIATLLRGLSQLLQSWTGLAERWSLWIAILLVVALVGGIVVLFGMQSVTEVSRLGEQLPQLIAQAGAVLGIPQLDTQVNDFLRQFFARDGVFVSIAGYTGNLIGILGTTLFVVIGGLFIALDASRYSAGLLRLLPPSRRDKGRQLLGELARVLQLWMVGQLVAMLVVGIVTGLGLYLLGMPSPLALGLLAGLLEFIPFVGPVLAYLAALILVLPQGLESAVTVSVLYLVIQQIESNLLVPLIQQRTVELPAALGLFALIGFGTVFGPLGLLFGIPLTVCILIAVKQLYIRDTLNEPATIPGEANAQSSGLSDSAGDGD